MRVCLATAAMLLAACGRIGFERPDALIDAGGGDTLPDGPREALVPLAFPSGGVFSQVEVAPDGAWYAFGKNGRIDRSLDRGASWTTCAATPGSDGIGVGPDNTVYAGGAQMRVSTDQCATWSDLGVPRRSNQTGRSGTHAYAMLDNGMVRRTNSGAWTAVPTPADGANFLTFASRTGLMIAGTRGAGLVYSTDGTAWTRVTQPVLSSGWVAGVAVGATKTYAISGSTMTTPGSIACGSADATTWTTCYSSGGYAIAVDPTDANHVVAAPYDDFVETTNGFTTLATQRRALAGLTDALINDIQFLPDASVVVGTNRGVFYSPPGPLAFTPRHAGLSAWSTRGMLRDRDDVFVFTEAGVARSIAGAPFEVSDAGMKLNTAIVQVIALANGDLLAVGRGVWRSSDRGATWTTLYNFVFADQYFGGAIAVADQRIYAGSVAGMVFADPPYATWTRLQIAGATHRVDALVAIDGALYAGLDSGLYVSTDAATTFAMLPTVTGNIRGMAILSDGGLIVAGTAGVWTSDPSRTTFTQRSSASTWDVTVDGETILLATSVGVYASRDRGETFTVVPATMNRSMRGAVLDPGDGEVIFAEVDRGLERAPLP